MAHLNEPIPSLQARRPEVPPSLEALYQKMMAKRPADRLSSMTELVALLKSCQAGGPLPATSRDAPTRVRTLTVFDEAPLRRAAPQKTVREPSIFAQPTEREARGTDYDLNLEDLVMDVRSDPPPQPAAVPGKPPAGRSQPLKRAIHSAAGGNLARNIGIAAALASIAVLASGITWVVATRRNPVAVEKSTDATPAETDQSDRGKTLLVTQVPENEPTPEPPSKVETPSIPAAAAPVLRVVLAPDLGPFVETARFVGHSHPWVEWVRVSPDGKQLLTGCYDRTARLWDIASGRELRRLWHPVGFRPVAFHPDGRRALTGCNDGIVRLWDLESGKLIRELSRHPGPIQTVSVSPDGVHALSGGEKNTLRLLEIETGKQVIQYEGVAAPIISAAISPDGRRIVAGCSTGVVHFGETNSRARLKSVTAHDITVWDVCISADSRHAASAGRDGTVIYWDLPSQRELRQTKLANFQVRCIAFEPDGKHLVFGGQNRESPQENGAIGHWDVTSESPPTVVTHRFAHLGLVTLKGGGFATSDDRGLVRIWERSTPIARARELKQAGNIPAALIEFDKAVAARPGDARLLIERGRLLTSLGHDNQAGADFEQAARLAPDNFEPFVDAGWWVASPYAAGLEPRPEFESSRAPAHPPRPRPRAPNAAPGESFQSAWRAASTSPKSPGPTRSPPTRSTSSIPASRGTPFSSPGPTTPPASG